MHGCANASEVYIYSVSIIYGMDASKLVIAMFFCVSLLI